MVWSIDDQQGSESKKIVWEVAPYLRGRGFDLGAGYFKILPHAISVDSGEHNESFGHSCVADLRLNCESLDLIASQSVNWVFSSHLLEHIDDYKAALHEWWRVIKPEGFMVLYLPHKDFYPNIGTDGANPTHKHDFLPSDIIEAMRDATGGWDLVECQDRNEDQEYSMLLVFKKTNGKKQEMSYKNEKPKKSVLVCRFGAFGDLMQSSSVFAGLKKQGYHVTLMTSRPGSDVILHDTNVDKIMLLDKDQIPNSDLGNFWKWQGKKYDKFVNLSESVEGTFLAMPGRSQYNWTPLARHNMMNRNYVEFQHELAGLPHDPQIKFFSTIDERAKAKKFRARTGKFTILWSLAGSSVHKTWAGLDNVIASIMVHHPDAHVVLCGGPEAQLLEAGWEKEKRVHLTCGKWSIRESLAFIEEADLIIGPETGVMNAAANVAAPKILFLSHSTEENLSRDWVNTVSLASKNTKCKGRGDNEAPACHQMHFGWAECTKDEESGVAQCQKDISVQEVFWNVEQAIEKASKKVA